MRPFPVPVIPGGVPEPMAALDRIKIIENNEPLVDIRITCPLVIFPADAGTPDGMMPFLRKTAAEMLDTATKKLPDGFRLYALSAWRSFERQKSLWWQHYDLQRKLHPSWPESQLVRAVNKYAAPVNRIAPPGHCTGAAIDVVLQTADGGFVDLLPDCGKDTSSTRDQERIFDNLSLQDVTDWSLGATWSPNLDPLTKETRMILVETMLGVGFSNCRDEYWHFSYGDSGWAVRANKSECCYGIAELDTLIKETSATMSAEVVQRA